MMFRYSMMFVVVAALAGCSKKDGEPAAGEKSGGKSGEKSGGGGAAAAVKLPKLGLELDVAGKVDVGDGVIGDGHMLIGSSVGAFSIDVAEPESLDDAKSDADMFSPQNLSAETLGDGWVLTFDNTGGMGANYFVDVRRQIGDKTYKCGTTASKPEQAKAVLAACKSLRAAS